MESERHYSALLGQRFPHLVMLESRRNGGVSNAPFTSLNLGLNTQDDIQKVDENRKIFFDELGISTDQIAGGLQVHQAEVLRVEQGGYYSGYDGFITNKKDLFLSVGIADCTPILIFDPVTESVGAAHAGWRGTVAKIVSNVLKEMKHHYGTQAKDCYAFIGTCINVEHFEVGQQVADQFKPEFVHQFSGKSKPHIDLKSANRDQLLEMGVLSDNIEVSPFSTVINNDLYFSYREENGQTGRMLAVIGIRSEIRGEVLATKY